MIISLSFTFSFILFFLLGLSLVLSSAFEHWHRHDESDSIWASVLHVTPLTPNTLILELNLARTCMCVFVRSGEAGLTSWTMALSMGFVLESQCLLWRNGKLSMHILKISHFLIPSMSFFRLTIHLSSWLAFNASLTCRFDLYMKSIANTVTKGWFYYLIIHRSFLMCIIIIKMCIIWFPLFKNILFSILLSWRLWELH